MTSTSATRLGWRRRFMRAISLSTFSNAVEKTIFSFTRLQVFCIFKKERENTLAAYTVTNKQ